MNTAPSPWGEEGEVLFFIADGIMEGKSGTFGCTWHQSIPQYALLSLGQEDLGVCSWESWEDLALTCLTHGSWQTNRFLGSKFPWCPGCASAAVWWHGDPICLKINQQHHLPSQFLCLVTRAPITDSGGKSGSYCLCELVLLLNKYFPSWSGLAQLLPYFRLKL